MKLTQRFGPIPVTAVLDGSGNGTVTFQPNGSNARITNLFVKVSTATAQATCTIYKGQVADGNAINTTNSGSTGAPASGIIDLIDGETLYVRWTGGDAGATATATFTGITIPFDQVGPSQLEWADPIAAGDGSLIFPAIKSPNFVPGVSGWIIRRNGTFELADGIVRGDLEVTNVSGSNVHIYTQSNLAEIDMQPPDSATPGVTFAPTMIYTSSSGDVPAFNIDGPTTQTPSFIPSGQFRLFSDTGNGKAGASIDADDIFMGSGNVGSTMFLTNETTSVTGVLEDGSAIPYASSQSGFTNTGNIPIGATSFTISNVAIPNGYASASDYVVQLTVKNAGSGQAGNWSLRTNAESGNNFDIVGTRSAATSVAFSMNIAWTVHTR